MASMARTHEDSRKAVCRVCSKKPKIYKTCKTISVVNERQSNLVRQFVFEDYNVNNVDFPTALCLSCNTTLLAFEKVCRYYYQYTK